MKTKPSTHPFRDLDRLETTLYLALTMLLIIVAFTPQKILAEVLGLGEKTEQKSRVIYVKPADMEKAIYVLPSLPPTQTQKEALSF